jgi:hypothetical protein
VAKRYQMNMRVTRALQDKLKATADVSGRSVAGEAEYRLEQSLDRDDVFGGPGLRRVAYAMATAFALGGQYSAGRDVPPEEWLRNPTTCTTAICNVVDALIRALPFDDDALHHLDRALASRIATRRAQRELEGQI